MENEKLPLRTALGIFSLSLATLTVEMTLIHVFDAILIPTIGYMTITCAMFSFSLAGFYLLIKPLPETGNISLYLVKTTLIFALLVFLIRPFMNTLPFNYEIFRFTSEQLLPFFYLYLLLFLLFFSSGLATIILFNRFSKEVHKLYFWNLSGAAVGSTLYIPFLTTIGPGGIILCASGIGVLTAALFCTKKRLSLILSFIALAIFLAPLLYLPKIYDFTEHRGGRGLQEAHKIGKVEFSRWDPISKIDIVDSSRFGFPCKHIAIDGGQQSSFFYPFDGNFQVLRKNTFITPYKHFTTPAILISHYLKRNTQQTVLIIGSAGGLEAKAAVMYGASKVDGVELIKAIIEQGKTRYAHYTGDLFNNPKINFYAGKDAVF